jgi:hypothetical protein
MPSGSNPGDVGGSGTSTGVWSSVMLATNKISRIEDSSPGEEQLLILIPTGESQALVMGKAK